MNGKRPATLRLATLAMLALLCGACASPRVGVHENAGNALPPDLEMPALSGSPADVADRICAWIASSQQAPPPEALDSVVVVSTLGGDGGRFEGEGLLNAFLQTGHVRSLTLRLDPEAILFHSAEFGEVYRRINVAGMWTLTHEEQAQCENSSSAMRLTFNGRTSCVSLRISDAGEHATRADFRDLHYMLSIGVVRQPVNIKVMTLSDGQRDIARSLSARFWVDGTAAGAIRRECEPRLFVQAFESVR